MRASLDTRARDLKSLLNDCKSIEKLLTFIAKTKHFESSFDNVNPPASPTR